MIDGKSHYLSISSLAFSKNVNMNQKKTEMETSLNLDFIFPHEYTERQSDSGGWDQMYPLAYIMHWGDKGYKKQKTYDGATGFLGHPLINRSIKKWEAKNLACEGEFTDFCTWPVGIWSNKIEGMESGLCRPGYYFSYKLWQCIIKDFNHKAQCDCPLQCDKPYTKCGTGWIDVCTGMVTGKSECIPATLDLDLDGKDIFSHAVCDRAYGGWIDMNVYKDIVHDQRYRFIFNTGNQKGKRSRMCQRPHY